MGTGRYRAVLASICQVASSIPKGRFIPVRHRSIVQTNYRLANVAVLDLSDPNPHPRILFVSSTTEGGSGRSQRELDAALRSRGVETLLLADNGSGHQISRVLLEQFLDASVRFEGTRGLRGPTAWLRSLPGRRTEHDEHAVVTIAPENALGEVARGFKPDAVVGSSISRPSWREIRRTCTELAIPAVLYLREEEALKHLSIDQGHHDAVLANSQTLVHAAKSLGTVSHFVPSVVDLSKSQVESTRERVLLVNPRPEHGVSTVDALAGQFPTIEFVLQESWPLTPSERANVDDILARHPNVIFRERTEDPSQVYRDAAILLAPHQMDNRPRTILEALANAIPVICSNLPGLVESAGPGGVIVNRTADESEWSSALERLWQQPALYRDLQQRALDHARRPEVQTDAVVDAFLAQVQRAVARRPHQLSL